MWTAGGDRPAVLIVPGAGSLPALAPALARAGFGVVSWEPSDAPADDLGRVSDALSGVLGIRAARYACFGGAEGGRDAILWAARDARVCALVTCDVTVTPEERTRLLEAARSVRCPWLLLAHESDVEARAGASTLARGAPRAVERLVTASSKAPEVVRVTVAWLVRHA